MFPLLKKRRYDSVCDPLTWNPLYLTYNIPGFCASGTYPSLSSHISTETTPMSETHEPLGLCSPTPLQPNDTSAVNPHRRPVQLRPVISLASQSTFEYIPLLRWQWEDFVSFFNTEPSNSHDPFENFKAACQTKTLDIDHGIPVALCFREQFCEGNDFFTPAPRTAGSGRSNCLVAVGMHKSIQEPGTSKRGWFRVFSDRQSHAHMVDLGRENPSLVLSSKTSPGEAFIFDKCAVMTFDRNSELKTLDLQASGWMTRASDKDIVLGYLKWDNGSETRVEGIFEQTMSQTWLASSATPIDWPNVRKKSHL